MKIRSGFVSNSSSSSFVIVSKSGKLTVDKLMDAFEINAASPLYSLVKQMAEVLFNAAKEMTTKELLEDQCVDSIDDLSSNLRCAAKSNGKIYTGFVSDEENGIECALVEVDFNFENDKIILKKEGGY